MVITDDRIIDENTHKKEYSELQKCDGDRIDSIVIDTTSIDVYVHQWNSSNVTVHLEGAAIVEKGEVELSTYVLERKLICTIQTQCVLESSSLRLDIWLPNVVYKSISIRGTTSNIYVESGIFTKFVDIYTSSGSVKVDATFVKAKINTNTADVDVRFSACSKVNAKISTIDGNIAIQLLNVRKVKLNAISKYGKVEDKYVGAFGYVASIDASSIRGNITVM